MIGVFFVEHQNCQKSQGLVQGDGKNTFFFSSPFLNLFHFVTTNHEPPKIHSLGKTKNPSEFQGNVENHHIDPPLPFFTAGVPGEDVSFRDLSRVPIDTGCLYIDRSCRSGTDDL